jgi:hypothetical protein
MPVDTVKETAPTASAYVVLFRLTHNGETHAAGDTVLLTEGQAERLLKCGIVRADGKPAAAQK